MKRVLITGVILLFTAMSFTSCRETTEKVTVVKEVEKEEPVVEEEKGILERAGEKVDNKVNEEIDEEIDKIDENN
ncbi:hypothetical protein DET49_105157 [Salegentibacter sp. 24]|jgi:hypothetical protein|uniref:hypothetical protein n=1 Tax=Salegentibacter sp. 24 TaxID=2183986 RepID=UPI00105C4BCC|nr:hypothetical protein [Salegentibacter sp. 24]TDN90495.1 hypothetical protein DET49_105157 [Salegentibacter sp. 24]